MEMGDAEGCRLQNGRRGIALPLYDVVIVAAVIIDDRFHLEIARFLAPFPARSQLLQRQIGGAQRAKLRVLAVRRRHFGAPPMDNALAITAALVFKLSADVLQIADRTDFHLLDALRLLRAQRPFKRRHRSKQLLAVCAVATCSVTPCSVS